MVYASDRLSPRHAVCRQVVQRALNANINAVLVPQVLLEFYATITRSTALRPLSPTAAWEQVEALRAGIQTLEVKSNCLDLLARLIRRTGLGGPRIFDLCLAAQMQSHGVDRICTDNARHFANLGVTPVGPEQVLQQAPTS